MISCCRDKSRLYPAVEKAADNILLSRWEQIISCCRDKSRSHISGVLTCSNIKPYYSLPDAHKTCFIAEFSGECNSFYTESVVVHCTGTSNRILRRWGFKLSRRSTADSFPKEQRCQAYCLSIIEYQLNEHKLIKAADKARIWNWSLLIRRVYI